MLPGFLGSGLTAPMLLRLLMDSPVLNRIGAAVDGRHATQLMDVRTVIGKETFGQNAGSESGRKYPV